MAEDGCWAFEKNGFCPFGSRCKYTHAASNTTEMGKTGKNAPELRFTAECKHWAADERCPYGARCHFLHGGRKPTPTSSYKTKPCIFWSAGGTCPRRDRCTFLHDEKQVSNDNKDWAVDRYFTKECRFFTTDGRCPHGAECHYLHDSRRPSTGDRGPWVKFEASVRMPRESSAQMESSFSGPRHDNDHDCIVDIQLMPTMSEIMSSRAVSLPKLDPKTWQNAGLTGMVDRQFRLMREESIGPIRDALRLLLDRRRGMTSSEQLERRAAKIDSMRGCRLDKVESTSSKLAWLCEAPVPDSMRTADANKRRMWYVS